MPNLQETIKQIKSKVPHLNSGGCGIFAYELSKKLTKLGIKHRIVIIDNKSIDKKKWALNNTKEASGTELTSTSFVHCGIEINNIVIDGYNHTDIINEWKRYGITGSYSLKEMRLAIKYGGWNSMYNRENNRILKQIIKDLCITKQ